MNTSLTLPCQGEQHRIYLSDTGDLSFPDHPAVEDELLLTQLGMVPEGCAAVQHIIQNDKTHPIQVSAALRADLTLLIASAVCHQKLGFSFETNQKLDYFAREWDVPLAAYDSWKHGWLDDIFKKGRDVYQGYFFLAIQSNGYHHRFTIYDGVKVSLEKLTWHGDELDTALRIKFPAPNPITRDTIMKRREKELERRDQLLRLAPRNL
jgi:hypothetical protein